MNFKKDKVLVVGASGIIGSYLATKLKKRYDITSTGKTKFFDIDNYFSLDLTNISSIDSFILNTPKFDTIIFLVGLAHKKGTDKDYNEFLSINKMTLVNLMEKLDHKKKVPGKIIFFSSISVYGERLKISSYNENLKKAPSSPYAVTKLEAERYLKENFSLNSWILRVAPVYSSNFKLNVNRRIKLSHFLYRVGDGEKKLSLCNLKNIDLVIEGILNEKIPAGSYNISDNKVYTYNSLMNIKNKKFIFIIPSFLVLFLYHVGNIFRINFIKENSLKLVSNNIFSSEKIRKFVKIPHVYKN